MPYAANLVLSETASLQEAIAQIEENHHRSVIVVDEKNVVVGTLSDGDIRKAILDRRLLTTPVQLVMNTNFIAVTSTSRASAQSIFDRTHVFLLPVIAEDGTLLDIISAY